MALPSRPCGPGRPGGSAPAPPSGRPSSRRASRRRPRRSGRRPRRTSTSPPPSSRTATRPCPRVRPAAVAPVSPGMSLPHRRQQSVRPHQPEHPVLADPDPLGPKPHLYLPVALAQERTLRQHRPDLLRQLLIAQLRLRAALPGPSAIGLHRPAALRPQRIHARTRHSPRLAHHRQRVGTVRLRTHPPERFKSFRSSSPYPPPFCQELRLQLDPHGHLSQLRPGSHQLPARPVLPLQALLAPVQEHAPPPLQLRRRHPNLPAHLADVLPAQKPQNHLGLPLRAPPLRQAFRPSARQVLLFRSPRHSVPPLPWTPGRWLNYCPEKSGAL